MEKFRVRMSDVPNHKTVEQWIRETTTINQYFSMTPEKPIPPMIKFTIDGFDPAAVYQSVEEAFDIYGWWGFLSHFNDTNIRAAEYGGMSITHNPQINNGAPEHASALGEPRFNLHDLLAYEKGMDIWISIEQKNLINTFYDVIYGKGLPGLKLWLEEKGYPTDWYPDWDKPFKPVQKIPRNSYPDCYAFRIRAKGATHGELGKFLDRFKRSLIRSRVACINGSRWSDIASKRMWHHDEPLFINTRINIPLVTAPEYVYEAEGVGIGHFEVGYGYSWDTSKMHRVYATAQTQIRRTHLVIGSSPWFDYIPEEDLWESNEFYGQKHPQDMLLDGDFFDGLKLA